MSLDSDFSFFRSDCFCLEISKPTTFAPLLRKNSEKYLSQLVNTKQYVLVEGKSKKTEGELYGRTSSNKIVHFIASDECLGKSIEVKILKGQESFRIKSFVKSNFWALLPSGKSKFRKGEIIDCYIANFPNQTLIL